MSEQGPNPHNAAILEDLDAWARGGWITAVERLIRWLKKNDCNEYAQPLARDARSFDNPPLNNRHLELRKVLSLSGHLDYLRHKPPSDLESMMLKKLLQMVQDAQELVGIRIKQLPALIDGERKAIRAVRSRMDEYGLSEVENELEGELLTALAECNAVDCEHRLPLKHIVNVMSGVTKNPRSYKKLSARLRRKGLIDSRPGKSGGIWLTQRGNEYVDRHLKHHLATIRAKRSATK